jgi:two-component sensor histidine kinase
MGELRDRQQSLSSVNEILEQRVAERTAELQQANAETERERDQIEALLADVNHRIGNNLQLVSSMLGLHARLAVGEEARSALHAARNQVQAIASAQRRLRIVGDGDEVEIQSFLEGLIQDFRETLTDERPITIEFTGGRAKVPSKVAVCIGVITNELINNAVKHAFDDEDDGRIQVSLHASDDGRIEELVVADDGKGISKSAQGGGLGGRIVQTLSQSLNAVMTVEAANPGTRVRLDLREMDQPA